MSLDLTAARRQVDAAWDFGADDGIVATLVDFIAIPDVSPAFDPRWEEHGHIDAAVDLVWGWCAARAIEGLHVEVQRLEGRTPLVVCEIPATTPATAARSGGGGDDDTVVIYGHLDKQPEMTGWRDGFGPWTPVLDGDRLYGRGGADDGYSAFAALSAVEALRANGGDHARILVLIEASEESGSPDLPAHLDALGERLGNVSLVIGLDSGAATYDRLWVTTSLRGILMARLRVEVLTEGVHSGSAGGVVPSSFRILRHLLDRIEDSATGRVVVDELWAEVPPERAARMAETAAEIVADLAFPFAGDTRAQADSPVDVLRARTWEPSVANIAVDGFPPADRAGNVLRPHTSLTMAIRLPPTVDPTVACEAVVETLTTDPPHGATVRVDVHAEAGWNAPPTSTWLQDAVDVASDQVWGRPSSAMGEGGTIPFMGMLGRRFPDAQFLITGVLGPASNAHGPNEFLHLPTARGVTTAVCAVLDAHRRR